MKKQILALFLLFSVNTAFSADSSFQGTNNTSVKVDIMITADDGTSTVGSANAGATFNIGSGCFSKVTISGTGKLKGQSVTLKKTNLSCTKGVGIKNAKINETNGTLNASATGFTVAS